MKQVFQDLKEGATTVEEVPAPAARPGHLLIRSQTSLISAGTERMLADFGRGNYVQKARQQPEKVRQVVDKARTDGLLQTVDAVRAKLEEPLPMGYANAGLVVDVGSGVNGFRVGQLVASNGHHAEYVSVPVNLCVGVPEGARDFTAEEAAFSTVGAIALQSIRLAEPTLGERFVVSGLGLVGLLTVQLLRASGCHVLAFDLDEERVALARSFGATAANLADVAPLQLADEFSRGQGVDGVIIAAATKSNEPVHQAANMCRKRGRIVLVGVTGLDLQRSDFYEKELSFQVSCSYGPGRYDAEYEGEGHDYPFGFVRWTSGRNQHAFLEMVADGRLDLAPLVSHRFTIDDAAKAYHTLLNERSLGITLNYDTSPVLEAPDRSVFFADSASRATGRERERRGRIAFIGAGSFSQRILLPAFAKTDAELVAVASAGGASAAIAARRFGAQVATSDVTSVLDDETVDTLVVATRHDSHAQYVAEGLRRGKNVFVEKPLAIFEQQLDEVAAAYEESRSHTNPPILMVGFNRRFSPHVEEMHHRVAGQGPLALQMTINAGAVPSDSWLHDPHVGGGRIVGEGCHFIDLARFLVGHPVTEVHSNVMTEPGMTMDTASIHLTFSNGSIASINYLANGHPKVPKERVELFNRGRVFVLDNFRRLYSYGFPASGQKRLLRQDKGHEEEVRRFVHAVLKGLPSPIPFEELHEVSRVSLKAAAATGT